MADGITRRIVYEGRAAKVFADHKQLEAIEAYYKQCEEQGANEYQIEESKKAVTQMNKILGDPNRLAVVARDFIEHYEKRIEEGSTVCGKAMFVCSSREIAYDLYKQIIALRPEWEEKIGSEDQTPVERIRLVMTREKDDDPKLRELIHSDKMSELLKMVREQYDYVVIDTSPIGLVPDATEIIAQSDLCLYVIRCLETNKNFAKNTLEQLSEIVENPDLIQIVLSDVPSSGFHGGYKYGYNYKGGYGYGYGYGYGEGRSKYSRGLMDKYHQYRYGKAERTTEAKKHYYNDEDEE